MTDFNKNKLLVILGPTATGKTDLALRLASLAQGELVSADSRQVYRGLDIGTGKLPGGDLRFTVKDLRIKKGKGWWEIGGIKIWMYDVVSPAVQYTVADYVKDTQKVINKIVTSDKLPIIVGGTGLYLKALLYGLPNLTIPVDKKLRKELEKLTKEKLRKRLKVIALERWKMMNQSDRENPRRLVRAIELAGSNHVGDPSPAVPVQDDNVLKVGLTAPREVLYTRADARVISRINQGMIEESKRLQKNGLTLERMKGLGLEYGVLADYLDGKINDNIDELIEKLQWKIHGYIRRQLTWFKKEKNINWFDITDKNTFVKVERLVAKWYYSN